MNPYPREGVCWGLALRITLCSELEQRINKPVICHAGVCVLGTHFCSGALHASAGAQAGAAASDHAKHNINITLQKPALQQATVTHKCMEAMCAAQIQPQRLEQHDMRPRAQPTVN